MSQSRNNWSVRIEESRAYVFLCGKPLRRKNVRMEAVEHAEDSEYRGKPRAKVSYLLSYLFRGKRTQILAIWLSRCIKLIFIECADVLCLKIGGVCKMIFVTNAIILSYCSDWECA